MSNVDAGINETAIKSFGKRLRLSLTVRGFALMEIIMILVILGIIGANVVHVMNSSWRRTESSNRMLIAGQMIERQIEQMRIAVDEDPDDNFPPNDSTFTENGITLEWTLSSVNRLTDPSTEVNNARKGEFTACWGTRKGDTLNVTTYFSKNF